MGIGGGHDERIEAPHFPVQNADGARLRIVGAKRIRTDEFGEASSVMRRCLARGPHLMKYGGNAGPCDLPGGLAAGKAAANHMDGSKGAGKLGHGLKFRASSAQIGNRFCGGARAIAAETEKSLTTHDD